MCRNESLSSVRSAWPDLSLFYMVSKWTSHKPQTVEPPFKNPMRGAGETAQQSKHLGVVVVVVILVCSLLL